MDTVLLLEDHRPRPKPVADERDRRSTAASLAGEAVAEFQNGRTDRALQACEKIVALPNVDLASLDACLWVAANAADWELAVVLCQLAILHGRNDAARHRQLSGLLYSAGRQADATRHAMKAVELSPRDANLALHTGNLLVGQGDYLRGVEHLLLAIRLDPRLADAFHCLAYAVEKLGKPHLAATLALRACHLDDWRPDRAMLAAHLLAANDFRGEAIVVLRHAARRSENPQLHRALGGYLLTAGELTAALGEIEEAARLAPEEGEYHTFRSELLFRLGRFEEATEALDAALGIEPGNLSARRQQVTMYLGSGRIEDAVVASAELLARAPQDAEYAQCMMHVLAQRTETVPAAGPSKLLEVKRLAPPREARSGRTFLHAMATQFRVLAALFLRETTTRFGESRLGYLWALAEPVIHIGALALVFQVTMHGSPPIGNSFFFFYFTGIIPYLLFTHTVSHTEHAINGNRPLLQLPMVTHVDVVVARSTLEFVTSLVVALAFIAGFVAFGVNAVPTDIGDAFLTLAVVWLMGTGLGMLGAVIGCFTVVWHHLFSIVLRILYFGSGIFYVPGMMPEWVRDILSWNPLLHSVDAFRVNFFPEYQPDWLDRTYPQLCALGFIIIGFGAERALRRRIRQHG